MPGDLIFDGNVRLIVISEALRLKIDWLTQEVRLFDVYRNRQHRVS